MDKEQLKIKRYAKEVLIYAEKNVFKWNQIAKEVHKELEEEKEKPIKRARKIINRLRKRN